MTRIASRPAPKALYDTRIGAAYVEAVAVDYDHARWIDNFRTNWPKGSPAHVSYFERIVEGPTYTPAAAVRGAASFRGDGRLTNVGESSTP